jgi:hypothetical protein
MLRSEDRMNSTLGCVIAALLVCVPVGIPAQAQTPDIALSYFVPEAGDVGTPIEGANAVRFFRACPNNDGGASLPANARIRLVLKDASGASIVGLGPENIYIKLNGGTDVQGFLGDGADSIIANDTYNTDPACPLLRYVNADAATDADGVAYITFAGADPGNPGVTLRDPNRKWGHYDTELPVYANGVQLQGRLTVTGDNGDYVLRIKNFDVKGGLANGNNQGEVVSSLDYNSVKGGIGATDALSYWQDFDSSGEVASSDFSMITNHMQHDCGNPMDP